METGSTIKKIDVEVTKPEQEIIIKEKSPKQTKSSKVIKLESEATAKHDKYNESEARELIIPFEIEFAKIPKEENLKLLDPMSLYECKIQTILLLQKILSYYTVTVGSKISEKDKNNTFLGIEISLLTDILRER